MERLNVLIVDDSRVSCSVLSEILSKTNFMVVATANNAGDAIEKYQTYRPDVVTMDMNLPDADGIECSRKIRAIDPKARILMISAMRDAALMLRGREAGIGSFLQKPVTPNELLDALTFLCQDRLGHLGELKDLYVKSFAKVLEKGLFSLVGIPSQVTITVADGNYLDVNGIAVIIGLTGTPMGRAIVYMDRPTMRKFACALLAKDGENDLTEEEASDAVEEAANIIIGRAASTINDMKEKEMRISPPGTICGSSIRIANFKMMSFRVKAETRLGDICMNIGFAEGE
ncbi:MAG: response regulator [Schwartzia sp. (in: firmicutes)]